MKPSTTKKTTPGAEAKEAPAYHGVGTRDGGRTWYARVFVSRKEISLGSYEHPEQAAMAREQVALYLRDPSIPLNFPGQRIIPASVEEVRQSAKAKRREWVERVGPSGDISRVLPNPETGYWGVTRKRDDAFAASVWVKNRKISAGIWKTAREAAVARDRGVMSLDVKVPLNEPEESRRLGPLAPEQLSRNARHQQRSETSSSSYTGVSFDRATETWSAQISEAGVTHHLGRYKHEQDAAMAFDQASLALRPGSTPTNFPKRNLAPATPDTLRKRAHAAVKANLTSRYNGVSVNPKAKHHPWVAMAPGHRNAGHWSSEREAAVAWDRAVLFLGLDMPLNVPDEARALGAASPLELRAVARADYKKITSSPYHGVYKSRRDDKWVAQIAHRKQMLILGRFDSEDTAAHAYEEAARDLHGDRATVPLMNNEGVRGSSRRRR